MKKGFTLLELLVVIAIIGILTSVVFNSINKSRSKARNAKRLEDIHEIVNAFHVNSDNSNVLDPIPNNSWKCIASTCFEGWSSLPGSTDLDAFLAPVLTQKPDDPRGGNRGYGGYLYIKNFTGDSTADTNSDGILDGDFGYGVVPPGNVVQYLLEFPANNCPIGRIRKILDLPPSRQHVQCYVYLP